MGCLVISHLHSRLMLGIITDRILLFSTAGDSHIVLQLAGVSLIGGASLELGRIASNEKMQTREDSERDETLANEFEEFATKKLVVGQGGSIHRIKSQNCLGDTSQNRGRQYGWRGSWMADWLIVKSREFIQSDSSVQ